MSPTHSTRNRSARRAARQKLSKKKSHKREKQEQTIEDILNYAHQLQERGAFEEAIGVLEGAVRQHKADANILEELGGLYMNEGKPDEAEKAYRHAIELQPGQGFEKYGYIAQLLGPTEEALEMARKGIQLLKAKAATLNPQVDEENISALRELEASAYCSIAEICLGIIEDSNDPKVAEVMDPDVEQAIMEALSISAEGSSSELEATLSLANLRLSQGRGEEAKLTMKRIFERIMRNLLLLEKSDVNDEEALNAISQLPPMEIRIAIGKQLLEVEMWKQAILSLKSIMWECDFNVEVWYLIAVAWWKLGNVEEARHALECAQAVLVRPDGYDGELDEELIAKLYAELDRITKTADVMKD